MLVSLLSRGVAAAKGRIPSVSALHTTAYAFSRCGKPHEVLERVERTLPEIAPDEVVVEMTSFPVTPADLRAMTGCCCCCDESSPCGGACRCQCRSGASSVACVAGRTGAGVVQSTGGGVLTVKPGDKVLLDGVDGTWSTHCVARFDRVLAVPKSLPEEQAALLGFGPFAAHCLLSQYVPLREGDVVLQSGADSAVALAVAQLCALRKVQTVNLLPADGEYEENFRRLTNHGATVVCTEEYASSHQFRELWKSLPRPVLAIDGGGGAVGVEINGGMLVSHSTNACRPLQISTPEVIKKGLRVQGFDYAQVREAMTPIQVSTMVQDLIHLIQSGEMQSYGQRFEFESLPFHLKNLARSDGHRLPVVFLSK